MPNFANFTNLYSLSKTLRFELKPIGATKKLLDETGDLFRKDKIRQEIYENILKPKLEEIDRQFIEGSLVSFDKKDLFGEELIQLYKNDKKQFEKQLKGDKKKKLEGLVTKLVNHIKSYSFYDNIRLEDILSDKKSVEVVKLLFGNEIYHSENFEELDGKTIKDILEIYFKGFTTYLITFNQNRSNFYKDDLKFGRVATRILKDNLPKFIENIFKYEKIQDKIDLSDEEKQIFDISNFIKYLNQTGIDTYNKVIGQINSKINEYNQKHNLKGKNKLPKLEILYKQILGQSQTEDIFSFVSDIIDSDEKLLSKLKDFIENENKLFDENIAYVMQNFDDFDLEGIWIKRGNLKKLSNKYLSNWSVLDELLPKTDKEGNEDKSSLEDVVNLQQIKTALNSTNDEIFKEGLELVGNHKFSKFINLILQDLQNLNTKKLDLVKQLEEKVFNQNFEKTSEQKQVIKDYLDTIEEIYQLVNNFSLWKGQGENRQLIEKERDTDFYEKIEKYLEFEPFKFYNAVRNYLTKKPYSIEKLRIYFDNPILLEGWSGSQESAKRGVIFRKWNKERNDWDYFLGIITPKDTSILDEVKNPSLYKNVDERDYFEKMFYQSIDTKTILGKGFIRDYGVKFSELEDQKAISLAKEFIKKHYVKKYPKLQAILSESFKTKGDFNKRLSELAEASYNLEFKEVNSEKLLKLVEEEKLYLFQIWNKDFSAYSKGKENLHTIYWKALFEEKNFNQEYSPVYKLNGKAEVFFRPKSNIEVKKRTLKDGAKIIENKRYTEHKILFHVPITLNFINKGIDPKPTKKEIANMIKDCIKENDIKIIGIDRGEKHLLYVVMIDENGKILEKKSLNCIINQLPNGEEKEVCYIDKLVDKEKSRNLERKNWDDIETIKELKEGYISQIVSYLVRLAVENNAIIVLEDLNSGFKRSRQKIERQIYQKFETALAKKLNYVVFKDKNPTEIGGKYKALQLAHLVNQYQDIRPQTGILFFTQAAYTSTTCPVCGFRKNGVFKFSNIEDTLKLIEKLNFYKENDYYYVFDYDLKDIPGAKLTDNKGNKLKSTKVKISTKNQQRIKFVTKRGQKFLDLSENGKSNIYKIIRGNSKGDYYKFDLTKFFDDLFENIDKNNLKQSILNKGKEFGQNFYKNFIFGLNLLLQLRNLDSEQDLDYIQCPACGFDSRNGFQGIDWDGDANGAYNIARRGKIIVNKIKKGEEKLGVSLVEWDNEGNEK